jgi:hypothetical protein
MRKTTSITIGLAIATILTAYISAVNFAAAALPGQEVTSEQARIQAEEAAFQASLQRFPVPSQYNVQHLLPPG